MSTITQKQAGHKIATRQGFVASALAANEVNAFSSALDDTGRMPVEWADVFRTDVATAQGNLGSEYVYVVWSYGTPIAWRLPMVGWTVPDVRYSATTSKHQRIVRDAIANTMETVRVAL